MNIYLSTQQRC